jgi:hypothetical protein
MLVALGTVTLRQPIRAQGNDGEIYTTQTEQSPSRTLIGMQISESFHQCVVF